MTRRSPRCRVRRLPWFGVRLLVGLGALGALFSLALAQQREPEQAPQAQPAEEPEPPLQLPAGAVPPRLVEPSAGEQHLLRAERTAAGTWLVLLAPGSDMADLTSSGNLFSISGGTIRDSNGTLGGFRISRLAESHPLYVAGLRPNDVLVEVNGMALTHPHHINRRFVQQPRPETLELVYLREEQYQTITCHLFYSPMGSQARQVRVEAQQSLEDVAKAYYGHVHFARLIRRANDLPADAVLAPGQWVTLPPHPALHPEAQQISSNRWLVPDAEWAALAADWHAALQRLAPQAVPLAEGGQGVRLGEGPTASPLYHWGLQPGDVLVRLNGYPVEQPEDVKRVLAGLAEYRFYEVTLRRGPRETAERTLLWCVPPPPQVPESALQPPAVVATPEQFGCEPDAQTAAALIGQRFEEHGLSETDGLRPVAQAEAWRVTRAQMRFLAHCVREVLHEAQARPALQRDPETGRPLGYSGLMFALVESDTLLHAYGFRSGDVIRYVGVALSPRDPRARAARDQLDGQSEPVDQESREQQETQNQGDDGGRDEQPPPNDEPSPEGDGQAEAERTARPQPDGEPAEAVADDTPLPLTFAPVRSTFELLEQFPLGSVLDHAVFLVERPGLADGWFALRVEFVATPPGIDDPASPPAAGLPRLPGYEPAGVENENEDGDDDDEAAAAPGRPLPWESLPGGFTLDPPDPERLRRLLEEMRESAREAQRR